MTTSSADRAFKILALICTNERPIGVAAIAKHFDIANGTVFRALDALEGAGYVTRYQSSTRYVAGPEIRRLKRSFFGMFPLRDVCMPFMRQIAFMTGEMVSLNIAIGWYAVRIAAVAGANSILGGRKLGHVEKFGETIASKTILAFREQAEIRRVLRWARYANLSDLQRQVKEIRHAGFGVQAVEFAPERAMIAIPIEWRGSTWASILIEGPVADVRATSRDPVVLQVVEIVRHIAHVVEANPELFRNPFAHLEHEKVRFVRHE